MERHELERRIGIWRDGYERIAEISLRQLEWLKGEPSPDEAEGWSENVRRAEEKELLRSSVEQLERELVEAIGIERVKELFREHVQSSAATAQVYTMEAMRKLEQMMTGTGASLRSTRVHRKAMNAYYGMDRDDQVALYFDQKK